MRLGLHAITLALLGALAAPAWAETAIEIKKELLPKIKKAQAEGKDLEAGKEYEDGDKALRDGLQEESLEHFKKAKAAMPKE